MRTLLALAAVSATVMPACLECGFEGADDTTYRRGNDALMVCGNGGFVLLGETTYVEGRSASDIDGIRGATGETGALAFQMFAIAADGTYSSPELGAGWQVAELSDWDRDHAHVLCADLESRGWWQTAIALPTTTTFVNGLDSITLDTAGIATVKRGNAAVTGTYAMGAGIGTATLDDGTSFTAVYLADGTLFVGGVAYSRVSAAQVRE
jgi:hypothetical protein